MELAIPIIALVGLIAIKTRKEKFKSMGRKINYLPNVDVPPNNYPFVTQKEDSVNNYPDSNAATDKYFKQTMYQNQTALPNNKNVSQIKSLTGNYVDTKDFTHENMTPYYTTKMGSGIGVTQNEFFLDNMAGSTKSIKKIEQAPLFKPQTDINWVNGMPNMDDFYLSRVNKSVMKNDERLDSVMVAPGLNKGFESNGSGGYNSGMEAREKWMDKTVDELRVDTNPKVSYKLDNLEGPSKSLVTNVGLQAPVNKNLPDSYYDITPDRYFTTPTSKGQMMHSEEMMKNQHRVETTQSYMGAPTAPIKQNGYVTKNYEESTRVPLPTSTPIPSAVGKGNMDGLNNVHKSHANYLNNRANNEQQPMFINLSQTVGSILSPIMDIIKPNRRDEMSHNPRIYGNAKSGINTYVANQTVAPTIKETTIYTPNSFQGQLNGVGGYVTQNTPLMKEREELTYSTFGNVGGVANNLGFKDYSADYRQTNNELKEPTTYSRTNHGSTQTFNPQMNMNTAKLDDDRVNNRQWVPSAMPQMYAHKEMLGETYKPPDMATNIDDRLNSNLLDAFKANPYTQSLQSY
jgi:hypothetical protein